MLKIYSDNLGKISDLIKEILGVKNASKISFKLLNDYFDSDMEENKLVKKISDVIKDNPKKILPAALLLMMAESFEYLVKYEDKYNAIKNMLMNTKSLNEVGGALKEDMWPFYPFFQEALTAFATLHNPEVFSGLEAEGLVFESSVRDIVFSDAEGYVIPISFESFFDTLTSFFDTANSIKEKLVLDDKISFHEISDLFIELNNSYQIYTYDFMDNYSGLKELADGYYNEVSEKLNAISTSSILPDINALVRYTNDKIKVLRFKIKDVKRLDDLEAVNEEVNDLKVYAVTRYNEFVEYFTKSGIDVPEQFNKLSELVIENPKSNENIDSLYTLIDEMIKGLEAKYERKKRAQLVRDLSIKIKNFDEFLIGLKTEIGDTTIITKRKMGNFTSKDSAELLLKRLKLQKNAYFKRVRVFDYLSMAIDLEDTGFKIYTRHEFERIGASIREMEKFLNSVLESMLPEKDSKEESDFENEGRVVDINGNNIKIALMNEDFSEISFNDENNGHTFNIHDYSAYHNLVDYAVDVRRQPVFQDYGDISEYPYFKPFKYQVDSVRTMLQRFEGRGVFGDQVGLGKTLEALMTADVMFRCATIKNAVVVTTKSTIRQWRSEAMTKFRHADGSPMFEIYPKHDSYSFVDLMNELVKDKEAKDSNALKLYLVSTEQIKSDETLEFIKSSGEYFGIKNAAYNPSPEVPTDKLVIDTKMKDINALKALDILKKRLPNELSREIKKSLDANEKYKKLTAYNVYGFFDYEYDEAKKAFVITNHQLYNPKKPTESSVNEEVKMLKKYTKKLNEIEERRQEILNTLDELKKKYSIADMRLVDLLIFDEVQDLLYDFNNKGNKEQLLQEFIANIQKKYCVLISATPIKNDLSDIFNLLYMVDKNRLGETKEKAEAKFYNAYCGGARSLSEMAAAKDASEKFKKLNGLINSMFTRKRLYDKDVTESIRRHSATIEEINKANEHNRDDYGGQAFMKLVGAIRRSPDMLNPENDPHAFLDKYVRPLFPKYDLPYEILFDAFKKLSEAVNDSAKICLNRLEYELRMRLDGFNVYDKFTENYRIVLKYESEGIKNEVYETAVKTCNLLCSYINRGLMKFYKSYQEYSTVFLSDYIDWRRPRKRGERINVSTDPGKLQIFKDLLVVKDGKNNQYDINSDNITALETGKVLFYEKSPALRGEIYRAVRDSKPEFGNNRRFYLNLFQDEEKEYELKDFIHLGYFPKGEKNKEMKAYMTEISNKNYDSLGYEDKRLLDTYTLNGTLKRNDTEEDTFKGVTFKWFTEYTSENENWNAVYFMDKTMLAGTDFNAANVLVIGQLDKANGGYMDPLELEQLIGRISRMGQTEECIVFTCLYNGNNEEENDKEFNNVYYDIMTDEDGFDLYGVCQTEVDFVMPVVMACGNRLFSLEYSYSKDKMDGFNEDTSDFKAIYKNEYIPYEIKRFPDLVRYAYTNKDNITVCYNGNEYNPLDALKEMIRLYSKVLRPENKKVKE